QRPVRVAGERARLPRSTEASSRSGRDCVGQAQQGAGQAACRLRICMRTERPLEFNNDYWRSLAVKLDVTDDIRHVEFATFVADHVGHNVRYNPYVGWYRWNGKVWQATGDD